MIETIHLISGGGSTSAAVWEAQQPGQLLHGLVKTVAVVTSAPEKGGLDLIVERGFPKEDTYVADPEGDLTSQLLRIFGRYELDYFHQLGWMPQTPKEVILRYNGLNQHLGHGGRWMYGIRRVYTHMRFCEATGKKWPIPIFCQKVHQEYDKGDVLFVRYEAWWTLGETPEEVARALLPIEHEVQIEALHRIARGNLKTYLVSQLARTQEERELLETLKKEARDRYPVR